MPHSTTAHIHISMNLFHIYRSTPSQYHTAYIYSRPTDRATRCAVLPRIVSFVPTTVEPGVSSRPKGRADAPYYSTNRAKQGSRSRRVHRIPAARAGESVRDPAYPAIRHSEVKVKCREISLFSAWGGTWSHGGAQAPTTTPAAGYEDQPGQVTG